MSTHTNYAHTGITELEFSTSLGTAIEGLNYRLKDGQGNTWTGITDVGGTGVTVCSRDEAQSSESFWRLTDSSAIQIEVLRDDGAWKFIGAFRYDVAVRKQVRVTAGAVAMPLQMDPV